MLQSRLTLLASATLFAIAVPAAAQQGMPGKPRDAVAAKAPAAAIAKPRDTVATKTRAMAVAKPHNAASTGKAPAKPAVKAVIEREANPAGPFARLTSMQRDSVIEHTRSLLGVRYKWAGLNPAKGLDCSGIVKYVFAKLGVDLPHHAADLAKLGDPVDKDTAAMQPGDLLVFGKPGRHISHVGIYVGDGMMIHASSNYHHVVETPVVKYRPPAGLQWKGVRRIVAIDSTMLESEPQPPIP